MKNEILEYLKETKQKLIDEHLDLYSTKTEQREPYGDTDAVVGYDYSDKDYSQAENYADAVIEEAFTEFFRKKNEVSESDFDKVVEKAKEAVSKINYLEWKKSAIDKI
jgi:hypothetical protein